VGVATAVIPAIGRTSCVDSGVGEPHNAGVGVGFDNPLGIAVDIGVKVDGGVSVAEAKIVGVEVNCTGIGVGKGVDVPIGCGVEVRVGVGASQLPVTSRDCKNVSSVSLR